MAEGHPSSEEDLQQTITYEGVLGMLRTAGMRGLFGGPTHIRKYSASGKQGLLSDSAKIDRPVYTEHRRIS